MRLERCVWLCIGFAGCFTAPSETTTDGSASGGSSSSGAGTSIGVTTNIDPSIPTTNTDAESSSSSEGTSSSSSSEGSGTTEQACPGGGVCLPSPPPEWDGPAVTLMQLEGDMAPMCPLGSEELWRAGTAPAAECDCSECGGEIACNVGFGFGSNGSCPSYSTASGCQPFSSPLTGQFWTSFSLEVSGESSCASPVPAEPAFRESVVGCQPDSPTCDGGVCLLGRACISRSGDHECPPAYPGRSLLHSSVVGSDLSCDTCECGDPQSAFFCSEAAVSLYAEPECAGAPIEDAQLYGASEACDGDPDFVLIEEIASVDIDIPTPDCSSSSDFENASGELVELGARTVCCADEGG